MLPSFFLHFRCRLFRTEDCLLWLCYTRRFLVSNINTVSTLFLPNSGIFFQCIANSFSCSFNLDLKGAMFFPAISNRVQAPAHDSGRCCMHTAQWPWYVSEWMFTTDRLSYTAHEQMGKNWTCFFFFFFLWLGVIFREHRLISPCQVWLGLLYMEGEVVLNPHKSVHAPICWVKENRVS
jgi:hypothetical protein